MIVRPGSTSCAVPHDMRPGFRPPDRLHPPVQAPPAQHTERMTFIAWRFKPTNLLLRGLHPLSQLLLRQARLPSQRGNLKCHVPGLARLLEAPGKRRIRKLLFEVAIKVRLFHPFILFCQSRIRSRAVSRSRAGIARPLFLMPCRATMRRPLIKNHSTLVFSLPTCRSS